MRHGSLISFYYIILLIAYFSLFAICMGVNVKVVKIYGLWQQAPSGSTLGSEPD